MARPAQRFSVVRYLPHSVCITAASLVAPPMLAPRLLALTGWEAPVLVDAAAAVALYCLLAAGGSWLWHRLPGTRQVAFGELMLWSWFRLARSERRLVEATHLLGFGRDGVKRSDVQVSPERQRQLLRRLNDALEAKDLYTVGHTRRVSRHSYWIAKKMRLGLGEVEKVRVAADVHDVGKVMVPDVILRKPGRLTTDEFEAMKEHSVVGAELAAGLGDEQLTAIVRGHHERWDGTGYPDRLAGTAIPLGARIIAVADTYDAITTTRSYRAKSAHKKAVGIIREESGSQFDPTVVRAFLSHQPQRSTGGLLLAGHGPGARLLEWLSSLLRTGAAVSMAGGVAAVGGAAVIGASVFGGAGWSLPLTSTPSSDVVASVAREVGTPEVGDSGGGGAATRIGGSGAQVQDDDSRRRGFDKGREGDGPRAGDGQGDGDGGSGGQGSGGGSGGSGGGGSSSSEGTGSSGGSSSDSGSGDVVDDAGDVVDDVGDAADDVLDDAGDAVDDVGDAADDVVDDVGDAADDVVDDVGDAADDILNGLP